MDENKKTIKILKKDLSNLPTIATRGVILFPNQEVSQSVGPTYRTR